MTKLSHPVLDLHDTICWDMDGTLMQNHFDAPNAEFFRRYIAENPQKKHIVVTFRDHDWAQEIYGELKAAGLDNARSLISGIVSCPSDLHDHYMINQRYGADVAKYHYGLTQEQIDDAVHQFPRFKGMVAKEIGATVLVDDLPEWVVTGCDEHDIVFVHAHDPV